MGNIIVFIIIILAILVIYGSKKKNQESTNRVNRESEKANQREAVRRKAQDTKRRLAEQQKLKKRQNQQEAERKQRIEEARVRQLQGSKRQQPDRAGSVKASAASARPAEKSKGEGPSVYEINTDELMQKVYDLMVAGPDQDLHFERDFLYEGIDMLNRIQKTEE